MAELAKYMATLVVEAATADPLPPVLRAPWLSSDQDGEIVVDAGFFDDNFHRLDRQVFDFSLAIALMRQGCKVRRQGWLDFVPSITVDDDGQLVECVGCIEKVLIPKKDVRASDVLAADWVVDERG